MGTLEYMAPEVLFKQPTTRASDVYAWAVAVNEMATGVFPFADCTKDNPQCQTILNFGYGRRASPARAYTLKSRPAAPVHHHASFRGLEHAQAPSGAVS